MDRDCTRDCSTSGTFSAEIDSSDDYLNDEILTDKLANEAISLMKKKLPTYVYSEHFHCYSIGYDTLDIIADLTNEDITKIEAIIKHDFVGDNRFVNMLQVIATSDMSLFEFQPDHQKEYKNLLKRPSSYLVKEKTRANESLKH